MHQITASSTEAASPAAVPATRLYYLDHLRVAIIVLVILLHASMTYMAFGPEWWYVVEPQKSLFFTALVLLLDVANMQALFFIAGFFAYPSLVKHGPRDFTRGKLIRLGIPWLFAIVFLAPLQTYLIPYSRGQVIPYLQFWTRDFWGPFFQQSVYWFLGVLLLLFLGLVVAYRDETRLQNLARTAQRPTTAFFLKFWGAMTLWYFLAGWATGSDTWINTFRVIVFQPARLMLYVGYFVLGIVADRRGWFRMGGFQPDLGSWGAAAVGSGVAYLGLRILWPVTGAAHMAAEAMLFNAFCLTATLAGVAFFERIANRPTPTWNSLSRNAYAIYYVHPLVLYPMALLFLSFGLSIYLEVAILTVFTLLASWAVGALVLTRLPILRDIF